MLHYIVYNSSSYLGAREAVDVVRALQTHRNKDGTKDVVTVTTPPTPESTDAILLQLLSYFFSPCLVPNAAKAMKESEKLAFHCNGHGDFPTFSTASLANIPIRIVATNDNHLRLQAINMYLSIPFQMESVLLVPIFERAPARPGRFAPLPADRYHPLKVDEATVASILAEAGNSKSVLFYPETDGSNTVLLASQPVATLKALAKAQRVRSGRPVSAAYLAKTSVSSAALTRGPTGSAADAVLFVDSDDRVPLQPILQQLLPRRIGDIEKAFGTVDARYAGRSTTTFTKHVR